MRMKLGTHAIFSVILMLAFGLSTYSQSEVVLIAHNRYLVGGAKDGKWLTNDAVPANFGKPTKFVVTGSLSGVKKSELFGTLGELGCGANQYYFSKSAMVPDDVFGDGTLRPTLAIGANANWNPVPRIAKTLSSAVYQKIALNFLRTKGIRTKSVRIERVISIDLEGDGNEEIFVEATNYKDRKGEIRTLPRAGNYSFVLMRKTIGDKARNFLLEGEFHPKNPVDPDYVSEFDFSEFADLNGDGKMEIVLSGRFSYGGESTEVFESSVAGLEKVLSIECGD